MNLQLWSFLLSLFCFPLNHQPHDGPQFVFSSRFPPSSFLDPLLLFFMSLHETWAVCDGLHLISAFPNSVPASCDSGLTAG